MEFHENLQALRKQRGLTIARENQQFHALPKNIDK